MEKEERKKLEEIVKKGKWNFVLIRGMLYWGGLVALFTIVFNKFILDEEIDSSMVSIYFIIFFIGGIIWGLLVWDSINKKLKKETQNKQ